MMNERRCRIYHDINSSLYVSYGETGLLFDGIWRECKKSGMTSFGEERKRRLLNQGGDPLFPVPAAVFFTHKHEDHYDAEMIERYLVLHPEVCVPKAEDITIGPFRVRKISCRHSGYEKSAENQIPHDIFRIDTPDGAILAAGDAELDEELIERIINEWGDTDLLFCNPLQIGKEERRETVARLHAKRVILIHIPEAEDDCFHMRNLAEQLCRKRIGNVYAEIGTPHSRIEMSK